MLPLTPEESPVLNKIIADKLAELCESMIVALDDNDYLMYSLLVDELNKTTDIYRKVRSTSHLSLIHI